MFSEEFEEHSRPVDPKSRYALVLDKNNGVETVYGENPDEHNARGIALAGALKGIDSISE